MNQIIEKNNRIIKKILLLGLSLILMLSMTACETAANSESSDSGRETVRINQAFQSLLYLPLYVAQEENLFHDENVDVKISTGGGGAQSWAAVVGGSADFSIQDPVFVPKSRYEGKEGVVVAAIQNAPTIFVLSQDSKSIQEDVSQFKGKTVITSPEPDTSWSFMKYLMKQNHLQDSDVAINQVSIGNELPPLKSNKADYALMAEPTASQAEDQGMNIIYSFSENDAWYPFAFSSLTSTEDFIKEHPEATQGVVTALERASRFIYTNTEEAVEIAQKYFPGLDRSIIENAIQNEIDAQGYPKNVLVSEKSWENNMRIAEFVGNIKKYPDKHTSYKVNVNTEFAEKAKVEVDKEE